MYFFFVLINIFVNFFLQYILDLIYFFVNKVLPIIINMEVLENYLNQKSNVTFTGEFKLNIDLYDLIINKQDLTRLINNDSNKIKNLYFTLAEYLQICLQYLEEVLVLNQKFYYDYINNLTY